MAVVGIDLGTTYSVIATPQAFTGKSFETLRGVTIIKDDLARRITPSVVAADPQGNPRVGHRAKAQAGQQAEPVMFVKRSMGEDRAFDLAGKTLSPVQVSAEILRYLKTVAEKAMGEPIDEAVITVPAYFSSIQKQQTQEAGRLAGLRVGDPVQEPVAAALAYCYDDPRDPLTIMTYDLGGGTFDVAILRREGGVFEIKAFGGDRHLGGYDFDKRLAYWMVERLHEQGYAIALEPESAPSRPVLSRLLVLAEQVKLKLTDHATWVVQEPNTGLQDTAGEPVAIDLEVTRTVFEGLIAADIEDTIGRCREVLAAAGLAPKDLDEIVLVGGSSRIPLVQQRLESELGRRPRLVEPDLSVAIGAAIMARRLGLRVGPLTLAALPEVTPLSAIQVTGSLTVSPALPQVTGCAVVLEPADGAAPMRQTVGDHGGFVLPQVPLAEGANNGFVLRVLDPQGRELAVHRFSVRREAGATAGPGIAGLGTNVLAKPIAIMTVGGLQVVAPEKTPLPHECQITAETTDQTGEVHIPIFEAGHRIGEILVDQVPTQALIGTRVEICLRLQSDFSIDCTARLPTVGREGRAVLKATPQPRRTDTDLKHELDELNRTVAEALAQADPGQAFRHGARLRAALATCRRLLYEDPDPNLGKVQELLEEVRGILGALGGWRPTPAPEQFERTRREIAEDLLPDLRAQVAGSEPDEFAAQLQAIVQKGTNALAERAEPQWVDANRQLDALRARIGEAIGREERRRQRQAKGGDGKPEPPPDPRAIKLKLGMDLTGLREEARRRERLTDLKADFDACEGALKAIDAGAADAMARLLEYYENRHQPLQAKVSGGLAGPTTIPAGLVRALTGARGQA